jgi:hypothetical protein
MTLADSNLRATAIERTARPAPTPTGRHRAPVEPSRRRLVAIRAAVTAASLGFLAVVGGVLFLDDPNPVPAAAATVPVDQAERNYLAELAYAGLNLTPAEEQAAVDIAREHVAHGHLTGMRIPILTDFDERIPRLTDEQIEQARVAVEHHFQAVTGRKQ